MAWHARLPASGAKRWMNCPGSVRLSEHRGPRGKHSSFFALEGTAAHTLGAMALRARLSGEDVGARAWLGHWVCALTDRVTRSFPVGSLARHDLPDNLADYLGSDPPEFLHTPWGQGEYVAAFDAWEAAGAPGGVEPHEARVALFHVTPDMADHVDGYVELCVSELERLNERGGPPAVVMVEARMDMSWLHPALGGTGDFIAAKFLDELVVVDLKFGKGVTVEVEGNEQELTYVVGAVHETNFDGDKITLWIAQPRKEHEDGPFRKWECTMEEVRAHEARLLERALQTERRNAALNAGEWCKFCSAAGFCPELAERAMASAQLDFGPDPEAVAPSTSDVQEMSDAELVRAGLALEVVQAWCKATGARLLERALDRSPEVLEHFKMVRKRSVRRYREREPEAQVDALKASLRRVLGLADDEPLPIGDDALYEPRKVLTGPKVEKMRLPAGVRRAQIVAAVGATLHKPPGGLTLALRSDPRDEVDPTGAAESEFEPVAEEE